VCAGGPCGVDRVLDLLAGLVDRSLVSVRFLRGTRRYELTQSIRIYAAEKLEETGEAGRVRDAHMAHFLQVAESSEPELRRPKGAAFLDRLELDRANFRAAMEWGLVSGDRASAERMALAVWHFWTLRGRFVDGASIFDRIIAAGGAAEPTLRTARLLYDSGVIALWRGDLETADSRLRQALELFVRFEDEQGQAWALNDLGIVASSQGDLVTAAERLDQSLLLKRRIGQQRDVALSLVNLGELAWRSGDLDMAERHYRESLSICEEAGATDKQVLGGILNNLGEVERCRGNFEKAAGLYRQGLILWHEIGDRMRVTLPISGLGGVAAGQGHPRRAARLLCASEAIRSSLDFQLDEVNQAEHDRMVVAAQGQLTRSDWAAACAEGRSMSLEEAVAYALDDAGDASALLATRRTLIGRWEDADRVRWSAESSRLQSQEDRHADAPVLRVALPTCSRKSWRHSGLAVQPPRGCSGRAAPRIQLRRANGGVPAWGARAGEPFSGPRVAVSR